MKFKFNIKLLIMLCALICLILSAIAIQSTYARYVTSLETTSRIDLGSWLITVNEQNIIANADFSAKLIPVISEEATTPGYIAENKLVPSSQCYAEITIDYSNVTVPFKYDLDIAQDTNTTLNDLLFTSYFIDNISHTYDGSSTISNTITPDGVKTTQKIKILFNWIDGISETMTNTNDTKFSRDSIDFATSEKIKLNFNIAFTQLY